MKRENRFSIKIAILVLSTCCMAQTKNSPHGDRHKKESHRNLPHSYRSEPKLPVSNSSAAADRELTKLEQQTARLKAEPTRHPVKSPAASGLKNNPGTAVKNPPINFTAQKPKNNSSQAPNRRKAQQAVKLR